MVYGFKCFISTHEGVIVYIVNCISDIEFHPI